MALPEKPVICPLNQSIDTEVNINSPTLRTLPPRLVTIVIVIYSLFIGGIPSYHPLMDFLL